MTSPLTELQRLGQAFDRGGAGFSHTLPNGLEVNFRIGRLDDMPSCKICGRKVCNHSDLEFAGVVPGEG